MFVGSGEGAGAMALPWTSPRPTPALWVRLRDPAALDATTDATRLRDLTAKDVHRLRYQLVGLPEACRSPPPGM
jgi:hypothetical protein